MTTPTPQRPPSEWMVEYRPEKRSFAYGIDRYLLDEKLCECLVEDYLTEDQAKWMCKALNKTP